MFLMMFFYYDFYDFFHIFNYFFIVLKLFVFIQS
jgi:hypothetical protein